MVHQVLPDDFVFSQSSLQAHADCARRFWLAYARQLVWPAVEASPVTVYEQTLREGSLFHRLVERAEIGIDPAQLSAHLDHPLDEWFQSYLDHRPVDLPTAVVETESILSIPLQLNDGKAPDQTSNYRLAAKYDLIAVEPGKRAVIIDWKTNRTRSDPARLRDRWQTLIYQYVLVEVSRGVSWGPIEPEQVEMRYWFTAAPESPITFRYSRPRHEEVRDRIQATVTQILSGSNEAGFPHIPDTETNRRRYCSYCVYRSLCNRGVSVGHLDQIADAEEFFDRASDDLVDLHLEDIDELAF